MAYVQWSIKMGDLIEKMMLHRETLPYQKFRVALKELYEDPYISRMIFVSFCNLKILPEINIEEKIKKYLDIDIEIIKV